MKTKLSKPEHIKYIIERSCLNKKSFSEEGANRAVDHFANNRKEMFFYKCDFCGSFHLTSNSPDIPKVIKFI